MMIAAIALFVQPIAAASSEQSVSEEQSPVEKYPYVVVLGSDTTFNLTDETFYAISRKVVFPVNKYVIPKNSDFRKEIEQELMPYMNDRKLVLDRVVIRGAASPEGPYQWNKYLSEHRAQSLVDLIGANSAIGIKEKPKISQVAEDYRYLLMLMRERGDADYVTVADIVTKWIDRDEARLKLELQRYDQGKLWKRLLREYFPELRSARVVLVFKRRYDVPLSPIAPLPMMQTVTMPTLLSTTQEAEQQASQDSLSASVADNARAKMPRRELLSVKTNLLHDFAYMPGYDRFCPIPNLAVEYYPLHGHFTFGASLDFPWWQNFDDHKYFQVRNYQLEARYYLRSGDVRQRGYGHGAAFQGWYLQAYAQAALYNFCFDADRGWEGEAAGGGLGFGYVMPLNKSGHWRLELGAQFGFLWTQYDPYQWLCPVDGHMGGQVYYYKWTGKPDDFSERQHRFTWLGPTRISITLSYDLLYRKRAKSGAGLRSWEKR